MGEEENGRGGKWERKRKRMGERKYEIMMSP
jgi:hypothetical protein